jgi:hypothetical protein
VVLVCGETTQAAPVTYGFSAAQAACGACSTATYLGTFSYDAETGLGSLEFAAPIPPNDSPSFTFSGSSFESYLSDSTLALSGFSAPGVGEQYYWGYVGGEKAVILDGLPSATVRVNGAALAEGLAIRHGLTLADVATAQIVIYFASLDSQTIPWLYESGCPADTDPVECANAGYGHLVSDTFSAYTITELHEIAEPSVFALLCLSSIVVRTRTRRRSGSRRLKA